MSSQLSHCSFCDKHKDRVDKLIVSHNVAICNECVDLCENLLKSSAENVGEKPNKKIPDPQEIYNFLNQHVVGQTHAKRILSVAITNHVKRQNRGNTEIQKSNILIAGPPGTGKTLMARTIAKYLGVPFIIADATTLTESGYVGDDVESLISRLYTAADGNIKQCERGIIFLDEIDKIAKKGESSTVSRDVSGEGVQQALLKLVEGTKCRISPTGSRKGSGDTIEIDTSDILFIVSGAFVGLDAVVNNRIKGTSIGFSVSVDTSIDTVTKDIIPSDLIRYGMIPEFVGRFSNIVSLENLTKQQLINILTEVRHNFIGQYKWLFDQDGVELEFDPESLDLIAERTLSTKTGARGLHQELERVLMCHMFNLPTYKKSNILKVIINKTQVNNPMTLTQENS